jgi:predicted HTH domain antitoxin
MNYISSMKRLSINIPNNADVDEKEARMSLASKLYERGKLTLEQAAELAGYSKETFMELLAEYEDYRKLEQPKTSLVEFFQKSPLSKVEIDLKRDSSPARNVDL